MKTIQQYLDNKQEFLTKLKDNGEWWLFLDEFEIEDEEQAINQLINQASNFIDNNKEEIINQVIATKRQLRRHLNKYGYIEEIQFNKYGLECYYGVVKKRDKKELDFIFKSDYLIRELIFQWLWDIKSYQLFKTRW